MVKDVFLNVLPSNFFFEVVDNPNILNGSDLMVESIPSDKNCEISFLKQVELLHSSDFLLLSRSFGIFLHH